MAVVLACAPARHKRYGDCGRFHHFTSGNAAIDLMQAARHSDLLMWVGASQNDMQSLSDFPPPPAMLGADCAGLALFALDDGMASGRTTPPDEVVASRGGDCGASGGSGVIGAASAGVGAGVGAAGIADGTVSGMIDNAAAALAGVDGIAEGGFDAGIATRC